MNEVKYTGPVLKSQSDKTSDHSIDDRLENIEKELAKLRESRRSLIAFFAGGLLAHFLGPLFFG